MKILCISGSNVQHKRKSSASTKICQKIERIIEEKSEAKIDRETIALLDFKLTPCIFCGKCVENSKCAYDEGFNAIYSKIENSDGIIVVVPHYAIIPAKLTMMMEKLNQIYYTAWIRDPNAKFALAGKKVAIIGHGGSDERSFDHYKEYLIKPLNYLFGSLQFQVIGISEQTPKGEVFGVTGMKETEDSIFPDMVHDWDNIEERITPLVLATISPPPEAS
ncbi:MAG: flavodoxin family protein [Candidatus Hodarchaeales archaeon]|jgi:multimeric flavodoxin WrbA